MSWYDTLSHIYDTALEGPYARQRALVERRCVDFKRVELPQDWRHGGEIFCVTGVKG